MVRLVGYLKRNDGQSPQKDDFASHTIATALELWILPFLLQIRLHRLNGPPLVNSACVIYRRCQPLTLHSVRQYSWQECEWNLVEKMPTGENRSTPTRTCPRATLSTTNPIWTTLVTILLNDYIQCRLCRSELRTSYVRHIVIPNWRKLKRTSFVSAQNGITFVSVLRFSIWNAQMVRQTARHVLPYTPSSA
jgi:hypothetical protein